MGIEATESLKKKDSIIEGKKEEKKDPEKDINILSINIENTIDTKGSLIENIDDTELTTTESNLTDNVVIESKSKIKAQKNEETVEESKVFADLSADERRILLNLLLKNEKLQNADDAEISDAGNTGIAVIEKDLVAQIKSETVTRVESEDSKSEDVIEKGEELKKEESLEDVKNEDVQQSDDVEISIIDDYKKLEDEKNDVIEKEDDISVKEREDVQDTVIAEIFFVDDCMVPEVERNDVMETR